MNEKIDDFVGESMREILRAGIQQSPDNITHIAWRAGVSRQIVSEKIIGATGRSGLHTSTASRVLSGIGATWAVEPTLDGYQINVKFKI